MAGFWGCVCRVVWIDYDLPRKGRTPVDQLIDTIGYVLDSLDEMEHYCQPGGDLMALNPALARHILLLAGRLKVALGVAEAKLNLAPPEGPVQKDHRLKVRWLGPQYACVGLGAGGKLVQREGSGPWRVIHEGPVSADEAQRYVDTLPGEWRRHRTAQVFRPKR